MTWARMCSQLAALVLGGSGYYWITGNRDGDLVLVCIAQLQWEGGETLQVKVSGIWGVI